MPVVSKIQNGFTAGELDPKLRARTDVGQYYNGAFKIRNSLVIPQGAAVRRPGLEYVGDLPGGNIQMIPFTFSADVHYLCILSDLLMTIYKNGVVQDTVVHSITSEQIKDVTWAQSLDTLLIFHREFTPQAFIRATETSWSNAAWVIINPPTTPQRVTTTTTLVIVDSASAPIDWTKFGDGDTNVDALFTSSATYFSISDVGSYIRGGSGGYAIINSFTSDTVVRGTVLSKFTTSKDGTTTSTTMIPGEWSIEDLSWTTGNGFPQCGTFFQGRLWLASTALQPNTIWSSKTNYETDFQSWLPQYADNGIEMTAGGGVMSSFKGLYAGQHLVAVADNGFYYVPISKTEPVTPLNASLIRNSGFGLHEGLPILEVDGNILFLRSGGKSLIESSFNFAQGSYINTDLSLLSSHLLNAPTAIGYRKQTNTNESDYILITNGDGTLAVLCTLRTQNVTAWTMCETQGSFVSVGVDKDDMYFAVDRLINGFTVRSLERFNYDALLDSAVVNQKDYLSFGGDQLTFDGFDLSYKSNNVTTLSHLDHLNGETVAVVADNTVLADQVVVDGEITFPEADDVQAGFNFPIVDEDTSSRVFIQTMPIEFDLPTGSTVGHKKRAIEATVMLNETSHCVVSKNAVTIRQIGIDPLDTPVPKKSKNITVGGLLGWSDEIQISVGQTLPLPFQLLGLAYKVRV